MGLLDVFETSVSKSRWELFEWCDLSITPAFIKHCCQAMLTAQWTHRLPIIQRGSPAELAAELIRRALEDIEDINDQKYTVIDFCSGAGGPIPAIEKAVNQNREARSLEPIQFRLSDKYPHIDAWIETSMHSANLSFIPQPVDATLPPPAVISKTSPRCPYPSSASKMFHLFCLSFHHFSDEAAEKIMRGMLSTSDGFAIIELQDRAIGMLLLMTGQFALLFLVTIFWFPHDWLHLLCTYWIPILPFVQLWDGLVSCLRTRTFTEVLRLAEVALGQKAKTVEKLHIDHAKGMGGHEDISVAMCGEWRFTKVRALHTWPFGYMNAVIGHKIVS